MSTHPWLADRTAKFDSSGIRKVFDLAAKMANPINLSIGQPDFAVPDAIKEAAIAAIRADRNGYSVTQGVAELRNRLQERVDAELSHADRRVLVTSGTSGALVLAILALVSFMLFGSYFAYDSISAIETSLIENLPTDRAAIGATYSAYSLAAIAAVLVGGFLIDKFGTRRASLLFSVILTAGACIVAFAPSMSWIYAGRVLFGMGSEPLVVAQSAILARWFRGKELALSFGVALTVSRLGTLFTFNTEALIAERYGWRAALWLAAALCGASVLANVVYNVLDKKAEASLGPGVSGGGEEIHWRQLRRGASESEIIN